MAARPALIVPDELMGQERVHRAMLDGLFPQGAGRRAALDPELRFVFLCFTNRCGSNYLAELIASSGQLNPAEEVFNGETIAAHVREQALASFSAYVDFLCRRLARSGFFFAKLGLEQLLMLTETGLLDEIGPRAKFILLERRDRLAQAISLLVAIQTQQWTSRQQRLVEDAALVYDRALLAAQQEKIMRETFAFYRFFASNGIAPKHLTYEDVLADPIGAVSDIDAWLGLEALAARPDQVSIARQESPIKTLWHRRFTAGL